MDFIEVANSIFVNKSRYKLISDKDKIDTYYHINKKLFLCRKDKKSLSVVSSFMNKKSKNIYNTPTLDKASAIDMWNLFLRKETSVPFEWYSKSKKIKTDKTDKNIPKSDKEMIMEYENLSESDYNFLLQNFRDDLEYKIKLLKRLE
jgi:hypothetical protein